jgi:polyphosphate glucokinase
MKILVVDVGGTNAKLLATDQTEVRRFPTGKGMTAGQMVQAALALTSDWEYEVVSIGFPGIVTDGKPAFEPRNLGHGWIDYDFAAHFDKPVKIINDAAMQALGSYEGGRMLFLGLGTGLGSTLIAGKLVLPLDLGQVPYRSAVVDDYVSRRGLERFGKRRWIKMVSEITHVLRQCVMADYVMLGGGNAKKITQLPPGVRRGANQRAFLGGYRLWNMSATLTPATHPAEADPSPPRSDWRIA